MGRQTAPTASISVELFDLIPRRRRLPGEDSVAYDALREALLNDLNPGTPYEAALAENLVELEWEAHRFRTIRDDLWLKRFRHLAKHVFYNPYSDEDEDAEKAEALADALISGESKERNAALVELSQHGVEEGALLAEAYSLERDALSPIERHIAELEPRRRRLREDYDQLKGKRIRSNVQDADVIENNVD
ncbi:hypothetical protein [Ovoidimarina sediminis]|uniref:hypothetical protein n=1 Tax=Ovoidimarina sediminis TaxID=3079856 RepID=UPI00290F9D82|nr:hypothetical protein [Rhodophyticola sp. MJ-SS7]MDU8944955.1 hypothetical protein [Rhodophyticola sp. MJ-SS7]